MRRGKDYIGELVEYIKKNLKKGYTMESLKWALINQGHSRREVESALKRADTELAIEAPVLKAKPTARSEVVEPKITSPEKKSFWQRLSG